MVRKVYRAILEGVVHKECKEKRVTKAIKDVLVNGDTLVHKVH